MRISSTSLALLALTPLAMANEALPLSRQLGHALESIQQQQSNTRSLTFKKSLIRALQDPTDTELACILAAAPSGISGSTEDEGEEAEEFLDGGGDPFDPFALLNEFVEDACDESGGICDFSSAKDEAKDMCDEVGGKIILNDFLLCKEDSMEDEDEDEGSGMDLIFVNDVIFVNAPVCLPQSCPDDSNLMELAAMVVKMRFSAELEEDPDRAEDLAEDMAEELEKKPGMKQECASGTKLATSYKKDTEAETGDGSSAAVRNIIWSFSVAATVGIWAFLAV